MENIFFKKIIEKINSRLETTKRGLANVKTIIKNTHHMEKIKQIKAQNEMIDNI